MPDAGFSRPRLGRMHDVMARYVERGEVPGLVTLLARRGEVHVDAIGVADVASGRPMRRDTLIRIASMTKPVTAVAAMMLVEECKVRLDDPVDRFLPELADRRVLARIDGPLEETVPAARAITLRDLLTFRMGFGMIMAPPDAYPILRAARALKLGDGPPAPAVPPPPDEWMRRFGTLPLMYQPGERWLYHVGSEVLGVLIARVAGQPFDAFVRERIFEPLGMKDTGFSVPADKVERLATSYYVDPATGALEVYDPAAGGQWTRPPAFPSGGAGLVSTADDYLTFARMLLAGGRHGATRLLARPTVELMTSDQLTAAQKAASGLVQADVERFGYGFGVSVITQREQAAHPVGQYGWDGGLGTSWRSDPHEDLVGIVLTQRMWTSPEPPEVCQDFWTAAYQAIDD